MNNDRLVDFLNHMREAASNACLFAGGLSKAEFLADKKTQQAVVMSLMIIGESTSKIMSLYPAYVDRHCQIEWRGMRGMRNRIVHGYFEINLDIVWNTVRTALPKLLEQLPLMIDDALRHQQE